MRFHLSTLSDRQQQAVRQLGPILAERGFYLAGGTAVALWLGHRHSVDLDWFTAQPFKDPAQLAHDLSESGIRLTGETVNPGTLQGSVAQVKVSMFEHSYPCLVPPVRCAPLGCLLAGEPDLAAMKILALSQRGAKRDFIDLFALARQRDSLRPLLDNYQKKYRTEEIVHVLHSAVYFKDAAKDRTPPMFWDVDWRMIQKTFLRWVEDIKP